MAKKEYYIISGTQQDGPYSLDELGSKGIERTTRVFRTGTTEFVNAEDIPDIKEKYFSPRRQPEPKVVFTEETKVEATVSNAPLDMDKINEAARRERELRQRRAEEQQKAKAPAINPQGAPFGMPSMPPSFNNAVETEEKAEWYIHDDKGKQGPLTLSKLKEFYLTKRTYVWRDGMADWISAALVPEISPYVVPDAPEPPMPPIQPAAVEFPSAQVVAPPPVAAATPEPSGYDTSAADAKTYGSPLAVPIASLFLIILVFLFGLFSIFVVNRYALPGFLVVSLVAPVFLSLLFSICGLVNASSAKGLYFGDKIAEACKKSGAATSFGWGSVALSIISLLSFLIFYI